MLLAKAIQYRIGGRMRYVNLLTFLRVLLIDHQDVIIFCFLILKKGRIPGPVEMWESPAVFWRGFSTFP
jgi:hypothetical protein